MRYFVRHPTTQLMPRKVKTAFDASPEDRALTGIHDIAFIARERDGRRGVEVRVGGGTSIMPRVAPTLYDFVGLDDGEYLEVAEAVFRIFDRQDWLRVNRARARIKVLVDKIGIDEMRKLVDEERQGDWVNERDFDVEGLRLDVDEADRAPAVPSSYASPNGDGSRVRALPRVERHRPAPGGLLGRPGPRAARRPQPRAAARAGRHRPHVLRRLGPHHRAPEPAAALGARRDASTRSGRRCASWAWATPGADQVGDVVSCPGTDSCKLGITSSMGLNAAVRERLDEMEITDPLTRKLHIKMSGCPNGCSQHHIANIGFYGASIKVGEHTIPAYVAHIAGNYEGGEIVYGQRLKVRLPAKRVPEAVERWIRLYEATARRARSSTPSPAASAPRPSRTRSASSRCRSSSASSTMEHFIDWDRKVPFVVQRGEGECAV